MNRKGESDIKDNPYSKLIEQMQRQGKNMNTPSIQIGRVVSPDPLTVEIGELQIDKDNILISDSLLSDYKRNIKLSNTNVSGSTNNAEIEDKGSHEHNIDSLSINSANIEFTDRLKTDDKLAILSTENKQTYIILAKVVRP